MAEYKLTLPEMGESIAEATVIKWLKEEGDPIDLDESVLEIATDKVDSDIPSPVSGVLKKKLVRTDELVKVGQSVAVLETRGGATVEADAHTESGVFAADTAVPIRSSESHFYSPLVKTIAQRECISQRELEGIPGTGANGRVTKDDMLAYVARKKSGFAPAPTVRVGTGTTQPKAGRVTPVQSTPAAGDEIIEMDRVRKQIAAHMLRSKQVSPHVTSFVEADVTDMVNWRNRIKDKFFAREGEKITFMPLFIQAVVKAIADFPMVNVSVDGDRIIRKKCIHIGMATALPSGNLIVPVIKNANQYSLSGLSKVVNDLAARARRNALKPDEIQDGTYTVTNIGTFGSIMGTPIINQPQVAILALGAIRKVPAVLETIQGDVLAIRQKMLLSHTYDHRVIDGALGSRFARRVADYLENYNADAEF
ncbi:MAG: dihydrolipoamide acetyltransferase family protein [Flavobacteriales bacterium]